MHMSHGGLQHATVRYYDGAAKRPGLPEGVGALVTAIGPDFVELDLVSLETETSRTVVVQAGSFGEYRFGMVSVDTTEGIAVDGRRSTIDGRWFEVTLAPGSGASIRVFGSGLRVQGLDRGDKALPRRLDVMQHKPARAVAVTAGNRANDSLVL